MNKIVFIIGASSGIGYSTAEIFLDNNYIVYNGSRDSSPDNRVKNLTVDISNYDTINQAVNTIIDEQGHIDILINSSGFSMAAAIDEVADEDYKYLFDVNLLGIIHTIKTVVPFMKEHGEGRIINISSIASVTPIPYDPYYSASKAALDMLTFALNAELVPFNIKLSSVLPGGTATDFTWKRKTIGYENSYVNNATSVLARKEQRGMTAEAVAKIIYKTAISKHPNIIIPCGFSNKLKYISAKLIPKKMMITMTRMIFKINHKASSV